MNIAAMLPYGGSATKADELTAEDILALCVYRGGPHAVSETFVRGRSLYRSSAPEMF